MKILFVSQSPINASVSVGNTFLNVFEGIEQTEFASLYSKSGLPDAKIKKAFRVSEKMILRRFLGHEVGESVEDRYNGEKLKDGKTVSFAKRKRWTIFFWLQNLIWCLPFWRSKALKAFLDDCQPDAIFTVLNDSIPLNQMIRFACNYTKKPLFVYAWDDNYSMKTSGKYLLKKINRLMSRASMRKTVKKASQLYVISKIQQQEYQSCFSRSCKILTKSDDFSGDPSLKERYGKPLRFLFTGNVGMNRWKSLGMLASVLAKINSEGHRAELYVYSGNTLTEEMRRAFEIPGTSFFMGGVSASEVASLQKEADVLVHVEGLDKQSQIEVRQSFSTKLVDYFKIARPILAIGPKNVASIEHLLENRCAIVAETECELHQKILEILDDQERLDALATSAYDCGRRFHDKSHMKKMLWDDIIQPYERS